MLIAPERFATQVEPLPTVRVINENVIDFGSRHQHRREVIEMNEPYTPKITLPGEEPAEIPGHREDGFIVERIRASVHVHAERARVDFSAHQKGTSRIILENGLDVGGAIRDHVSFVLSHPVAGNFYFHYPTRFFTFHFDIKPQIGVKLLISVGASGGCIGWFEVNGERFSASNSSSRNIGFNVTANGLVRE